MKALVTFALLALFAITGEAATSAWDDSAINPDAGTATFLTSDLPTPPPGELGITLIIVGPDPNIPPLPSLEDSDIHLVPFGDAVPEPTSGLLVLVGATLLALRRRIGE